MVSRGMKRPAAAISTHSPKQPRTTITADSYKDIAAAIRNITDVPGQALEMLVTTLPSCLGVAKDQRHEYQHAMIQMCEETLASIEAEMEASVAEASTKLASGPEDKLRRGTAVVEAKSAQEAAMVIKEQQQSALTHCRAVEKETHETLTKAKSKQKEIVDKAGAISAKKTEIGNLVSDKLAPMKVTGGGKKEVSALIKGLKLFEGIDTTLLQALPTTLNKALNDYSSFDHMVIKQLDEAVAAVIGKFDADLMACTSSKTECDSDVMTAETAYEQAKTANAVADAAHGEAVVALKGAQDALQKAEALQASFDADMRNTALELDTAREKLVTFKSGPLATFVVLRDKTSTPLPTQGEKVPEETEETVDGETVQAPLPVIRKPAAKEPELIGDV